MVPGYLDFIMKAQEHLLSGALPEDTEKHAASRKRVSDLLADTVAQLVTIIQPGTILEIGAHEASFSRAIKAALPKSRVVAFEANPSIYEKYERSVSEDGVEYLFQCVADENRTYKFSIPGTERAHPTMGSVLRHTQKDVFASYDVPGTKLDTFLGASTTRNAMWIDVEGAVGSVLSGAHDALGHCDLLFAELEARERWEGQMLDKEVIQNLAGRGMFPVLRDIQRHKWQHNILFLGEDALVNPKVQSMCFDYLRQAAVA